MINAIIEQHYPSRTAELKRSILQTALQCFNEQGIESTTIEMIKNKSQTSVGAIYHHFGTKEGIIAALYFLALENQQQERSVYFQELKSIKDMIYAVVNSYIEWVEEHKELARFQMYARHYVQKSEYQPQLKEHNTLRNKQFFEHLKAFLPKQKIKQLPISLIIPLVIGPCENYTRAWLSETVSDSPKTYRDDFSKSAWMSVRRYFE